MVLKEKLIQLNRILLEIDRDYNLRWWNYASSGIPLDTTDLNEKKKKIYWDDSIFNALKAQAIENDDDDISNRRINLYLHQFYLNRVELDRNLLKLKNEIIEDELSSESTINGKTYSIVNLKTVVNSSPNANLQIEARNKLAEINEEKEDKFLEIIRLRNELSQKLGFKSYTDIYFYSFKPTLDEHIEFVEKTITRFTKEAQDWEFWIKSCPGDNNLSKIRKIQEELSIYYDILKPEETFIDLLKFWGLENLLTRIHLFTAKDLPNKKHWWTFCQPIIIPDDIRISINKLGSFEFVETFYHEMGHAIHYASIEQNEWVFKKEDLLTEIPASFMANMCLEDEWIEKFLKIKDKVTMEKIKKVNISRDPVSILSRCLDFLLMIELYKGEENPDKIFNDLYKRIFGYRKQSSISAKKWNFEILFVEEPFYGLYHLLGEIMGKRILDFIVQDCGSIFCKNVGGIIVDKLFKPGNSIDWYARVKSISPLILK